MPLFNAHVLVPFVVDLRPSREFRLHIRDNLKGILDGVARERAVLGAEVVVNARHAVVLVLDIVPYRAGEARVGIKGCIGYIRALGVRVWGCRIQCHDTLRQRVHRPESGICPRSRPIRVASLVAVRLEQVCPGWSARSARVVLPVSERKPS